jgi:hypothetical protein
MRSLRLVALFAALLTLTASPVAHAQRRVALVVGNGEYKHTGKLPNPRTDASDISAALKALGFQVIEGLDLDKPAFDRRVLDFATALKSADAGVFFYAGHGLQVSGQNYLVPVDAKAEEAAHLDLEMVRVDVVHRMMERQTNTNILFLDACRDNPLARNLARSMGTRSAEIGRGLAAVESGVGTLISFSTQPGNVALDGSGRNSPFAAALLRQLASASDDLSSMLIAVRTEVVKATQGKQVPWEHSALMGRFYFGSVPQPATGAPLPQISDASREWALIDKTSLAEIETFVRRHGSSPEAVYARARIEALRKQQMAAAAPPVPSAARPPAEPRQSVGGMDQSIRMSGGKTISLLDGRLSFTMIGTPHGARSDLVGVRLNGKAAPLAVGQLVLVNAQPNPCAIILTGILGRNDAEFAFRCDPSLASIARKNITATVEIASTGSGSENFTMSGGKTRQLQPGNVLLTFIATPYAASGVHAGIRVHGETKALTVGERFEVRAGSQACFLTLREIHSGRNSAEFNWQC